MKKTYSAPSVQRYALYQKDGVLTTTSLPMDDNEVDGSQALIKEEKSFNKSSVWENEW